MPVAAARRSASASTASSGPSPTAMTTGERSTWADGSVATWPGLPSNPRLASSGAKPRPNALATSAAGSAAATPLAVETTPITTASVRMVAALAERTDKEVTARKPSWRPRAGVAAG